MGAKSAIVMPSSCLPHTAETINMMTPPPPIDHATHLPFLSAACTCCPGADSAHGSSDSERDTPPAWRNGLVFHLSVAALMCYLGAEASSC
jgi:hypothetical protein